MKQLLICVALATSSIIPTAAAAQAVPAAVVAVVDLEKVTSQCNACKTASATLRGQVTALQNRQKALATPLETEQKGIQGAIDALNGKEPDAALQARVRAFQTKQQQGASELQTQQTQIQRNSAYVQKQIQDKLGPIYTQVMQRRGANILVEIGTTLASAATLDVTGDVVAALNVALPAIQTDAPKQQTPQGR